MDLVYAVNMLAIPAVLMFFAGLAMLAVEVLAKPGAMFRLAPSEDTDSDVAAVEIPASSGVGVQVAAGRGDPRQRKNLAAA